MLRADVTTIKARKILRTVISPGMGKTTR